MDTMKREREFNTTGLGAGVVCVPVVYAKNPSNQSGGWWGSRSITC